MQIDNGYDYCVTLEHSLLAAENHEILLRLRVENSAWLFALLKTMTHDREDCLTNACPSVKVL